MYWCDYENFAVASFLCRAGLTQGSTVSLRGSFKGSFKGYYKGSIRGLRVSIAPVWFLVGNGGMGYWGIV